MSLDRSSPTIREELENAIMDSDVAFKTMSTQALNSEKIRERMKDIILGPGRLYERLKAHWGERLSGPPGQ